MITIRIIIATVASLLLGTALLTAGPTYTIWTYKGFVTDTMCGADHSKMQTAPESKCIQECVRGGARYALLSGQNVYVLSNQKRAAKFAADFEGHKVKISGTLDSKKNLTVVSISRAD